MRGYPTPDGVPMAIRSPGNNVVNSEMIAIVLTTEKMALSEEKSWSTLRLPISIDRCKEIQTTKEKTLKDRHEADNRSVEC